MALRCIDSFVVRFDGSRDPDSWDYLATSRGKRASSSIWTPEYVSTVHLLPLRRPEEALAKDYFIYN